MKGGGGVDKKIMMNRKRDEGAGRNKGWSEGGRRRMWWGRWKERKRTVKKNVGGNRVVRECRGVGWWKERSLLCGKEIHEVIRIRHARGKECKYGQEEG